MIRKMEDTDTEEEFVESFRKFNPDGNGLINVKQLHEIMKMLIPDDDYVTEEEVEAMIHEADDDIRKAALAKSKDESESMKPRLDTRERTWHEDNEA